MTTGPNLSVGSALCRGRTTVPRKPKAFGLLLFFSALFIVHSLGSFGAGYETEAASAVAPKGPEHGTPAIPDEEHGLSQKALEIARPFGFPITNSMMVSWIVALGLIIFAQSATRDMKQVPKGAQNFL